MTRQTLSHGEIEERLNQLLNQLVTEAFEFGNNVPKIRTFDDFRDMTILDSNVTALKREVIRFVLLCLTEEASNHDGNQ